MRVNILTTVVALTLGAALAGCGGQTKSSPGADGGSGGSSGSSGSSSGGVSIPGGGCSGGFMTAHFAVNPAVCAPQLEQTTSCNGEACSWNVEVPCDGHSQGEPDAGDDEAGSPAWCAAMCNAAAPAGARQVGTCDAQEVDAGVVFIQCAGCGV